ncbi:hypothetical protein B0H16DRAFT_1722925 [Mycena metata]|uniref:Uncharacterized protein n=1 Tax=Mycena metata TaxID=1033252 RepID=A0AAD7J3N8_9AGAR|nr:hypothetical protein B0H16DRAFT_1722925 [Mycena metata]
MANVPGAAAAAFIAAQQSLRAAENDAFDTNSVLDPNNQDLVNAHVAALARVQAARLVCNAAAGPAYETTRALVEDLLSHFLEFKVSVGPTVPATFVNALLETSFSSLGQQLEDAAAPTAVIIDFRAALGQPTFGAAMAYFDQAHISDVALAAFIVGWRADHEESVSERGDSTGQHDSSTRPRRRRRLSPSSIAGARRATNSRASARSRTASPAPGPAPLPTPAPTTAAPPIAHPDARAWACLRPIGMPPARPHMLKKLQVLLPALSPSTRAIPGTKLLQSAVPFQARGLFFWRISMDMMEVFELLHAFWRINERLREGDYLQITTIWAPVGR